MNEFDIIKIFFAPLAHHPGALNLKDDAAIFTIPAGNELVVTKDAMVSGVHFIGNESPESIARKLLRVNLSDLAAMGATPCYYFLALMLPATTPEHWIRSFASGLAADQKEYGITLMGGDTTHTTTGALALSLTAFGLVPEGQSLKRSGAKAGDAVYVSGTIGDAALGLQVAGGKLQVKGSGTLLQRYQLPQPRIALGQKLRGIANACMDISDGLMQDMEHIATSSGVGATLHQALIPLSMAARYAMETIENPWQTIVAGGDDYELLFTVPLHHISRLESITDVTVTRIGTMTEGKTIQLLDKHGEEMILARKGYRHF